MPGSNPFKPTAGATPAVLAGRDDLIELFLESIEDGPGAPGRMSVYTGPSGSGKTALLNALGERLQADYQWLVIHETGLLITVDEVRPDARANMTRLSAVAPFPL